MTTEQPKEKQEAAKAKAPEKVAEKTSAKTSGKPTAKKREKTSEATAEKGRTRATSRTEKVKRAPNPELKRRVLIVLGVVAFAIIMLYRPTRDLYIAWRTGYVLESRYEVLAEENEELNEDLERLMTRDGIEDEARKRGYVMPGETSVKVDGLEYVDDGEPDEVDSAGELPWYIHLGDVIFFYSEDE